MKKNHQENENNDTLDCIDSEYGHLNDYGKGSDIFRKKEYILCN